MERVRKRVGEANTGERKRAQKHEGWGGGGGTGEGG